MHYVVQDIGFARPVMIIMDRGVDLPLMLHHPWTYHALAADTLEEIPRLMRFTETLMQTC